MLMAQKSNILFMVEQIAKTLLNPMALYTLLGLVLIWYMHLQHRKSERVR